MAPSASPRTTESPKRSQSQQSTTGPDKVIRTVKKETAPPGGRDIRNFFSQGSSSQARRPVSKGTGDQPISIDDSDDDDNASSKPKATSSKHFSNSNNPISVPGTPEPESKPSKASLAMKAITTNTKRRYVLDSGSEDDDDVKPPPPKKATPSSGKKAPPKKSAHVESSSEDDFKPVPKKGKGKGKGRNDSPMDLDESSESEDFDDDFDESDEAPTKGKGKKPPAKPPAKKATPKTTPKKAAPVKKPTPKKPAAPPPQKEVEEQVEEVEQPVPKKSNFRNYMAVKAARAATGPRDSGKDIPEGAPDCLAGLTFVFTGELQSLGREDAVELVKRYSGRVTGAPSSKTSYVVLGDGAGESKMKKIREHGLKTLDEDGLFDLIRTRTGGQLDEKTVKAREKEEKKIEEQAKEMEAREKAEESQRKRKEAALQGTGIAAKKVAPVSAQLWTTKYAPTSLKEICGNKAPVERLGQWLQDWDKNYKSGFKKPGKDGMGIFRAVLISGPPGIGKTTSAHLMAKQAGYNPIELNASDARSKKLIENFTNIDNTSLDGFFAGKGVNSTAATGEIRVDSRTCLIMDEVDGMSAGDRGGVGALNALVKKTKIPMVLICNDRSLQKMRPLHTTTYNMSFRRPGPNEVRSRIMSILYKEKLKIPPNVVDELVKGANSDIRQVLNMLSTFKLGKSEMDFDEGKNLVKINEKNTILTPFSIIDRLTSPYAFSRTNKETLGDKMELYFHDFSFVPLFMQEHYIKTNPATLTQYDGPEKDLKHLELLSKAADSISDGDLIDRMIHGSEQHWSLLPLHAVASTVRPAYHIYGATRHTGGGGYGSWGPAFPQWLGQNSKQTKLQRQLTDIQIRMRLRVSGSRQEIREQYMPTLASHIITPLTQRGADAVEETIEYMDEYFLTKEDWDAIVELGVDTMKMETVTKQIPAAAKSAFTRTYNKQDHPVAFHRGDMFALSKKKIKGDGPAPDNEDVFEEDEAVPDDDEEEDGADDDVDDVAKDRLVKAVKPKAAKGKAAEGKAKAKKK